MFGFVFIAVLFILTIFIWLLLISKGIHNKLGKFANEKIINQLKDEKENE